jgi:hypothetical protein
MKVCALSVQHQDLIIQKDKIFDLFFVFTNLLEFRVLRQFINLDIQSLNDLYRDWNDFSDMRH